MNRTLPSQEDETHGGASVTMTTTTATATAPRATTSNSSQSMHPARRSSFLQSLVLTRQSSTTTTNRRMARRSKRVKDIARQCFLYAAAFYVNWAALTATRLIRTLRDGRTYYPLVLAAAICGECTIIEQNKMYAFPSPYTCCLCAQFLCKDYPTLSCTSCPNCDELDVEIHARGGTI